jgi:transcriptional regulator with XRE-family HTH domain
VAALRRSRGWSQQQLAEALQEIAVERLGAPMPGLSRPNVAKFEAGKEMPPQIAVLVQHLLNQE